MGCKFKLTLSFTCTISHDDVIPALTIYLISCDSHGIHWRRCIFLPD